MRPVVWPCSIRGPPRGPRRPAEREGMERPRPWSEVEQATATVLAMMIALDPAGCGFTLATCPTAGWVRTRESTCPGRSTSGFRTPARDAYELAVIPPAVIEELTKTFSDAGEVPVQARWMTSSRRPPVVAGMVAAAGGRGPAVLPPARRRGDGRERQVLPGRAVGAVDLDAGDPGAGTEYPASEWEGSSPWRCCGRRWRS